MTVCLSACGADTPAQIPDSGEIHIVTTIFPEYDWVMNVLGDNPAGIEVTLLIDNGVDIHSYQPSTEDILRISTCDMFIYVGGESDEWVEDALKEAMNKDMSVINVMEILGDTVREEEVTEGMQEEEHEHDQDPDEHEEETEYDEHVWLSLRNAAAVTEQISKELQKLDEANAQTYRKNAEEYTGKLNDLDRQYAEAVSNAPVKTLLFGDRFPFRYLTDDYGITYYAAFAGCSAETEASFETIRFLSEKTDELSLHAVMTIDGSDGKIAETIIQNTETKDQKILTLDSMQSVALKDIQNGTTYLSVMENNLSVLKEALK